MSIKETPKLLQVINLKGAICSLLLLLLLLLFWGGGGDGIELRMK